MSTVGLLSDGGGEPVLPGAVVLRMETTAERAGPSTAHGDGRHVTSRLSRHATSKAGDGHGHTTPGAGSASAAARDPGRSADAGPGSSRAGCFPDGSDSGPSST